MLCSVSTGKSGSRWLDRLRTAKGLTDDGPTDLEKFLQNPIAPNHEMVDPKPNSAPIRDPTQNEDTQLYDIMSNVLNELFNFGDNRSNPTKFTKSARKQKTPRICAIPSNGSGEDENAASEKATTLLRSCDGERVKELDRCENEGRDVNLVGFSRTEVTVIDTSYESWKSEKFLYRKKNVWKVRDKRVKSVSVGSKKKRRLSGGGGVEEERHGGKKSKVDKNEGCGEECDLPLNEINISEVHEKALNKVGGTLANKQLDLKLENGSSSVILIKSIHTSTKNGTSISKSCLKSKQKNT